MAEDRGEERSESGGLIGLAISLSRKAGKEHGDPKQIRKIQEVMANVRPPETREHEKVSFFHAFFDELKKMCSK